MQDLKERSAFTLSSSIKEELESVVPKSKRSQFVEHAIATALLEEAKRRALAAIDAAPCIDTQRQNSVEILTRIRRERRSNLVSQPES